MLKYLNNANLPQELVARMGGKAARLHELLLQGFNVPLGFTLMKPEWNLDELKKGIESIGGFPVAVRSSCSLEDMSNASFAGLYETFLYVKSFEELEKTIKLCFDSIHSERVKDYFKTKNIKFEAEALQMCVLVQKMVDPLIAGVLFTLNPTNGKEEEFYLEYCQGVGERLVSGHVTPSSYTYNIDDKKVVASMINSEETTIKEKALKTLVEESKKIQAYFGAPQDIEWAISHEGELFILQSRPITTYSVRDDVPELTNADLKDGGISARVCTPFMFSAYRNALQHSMGQYFKNIRLVNNPDEISWIHSYYGRVYWNAGAVKEGLKSIPGFNEEDFDRDLGIQKDYGSKGPHKTGMSVAALVHAIPILMGLYREFDDCEIMVEQFRDQFEFRDENFKEKLPFISRMTEDEFKQWFGDVIRFQHWTEQNYFRTIYNNANFQSEFKASLKKIKAYQEGDEVELMANLSEVSHLDVQGDLEKLVKTAHLFGFDSSSYYKQREKFLSHHYHHGPAELDITIPRWGEKKEWVDDLVRGFTPTRKITTGVHETSDRLVKSIGIFSRGKFLKNLARSRNFLKVREEMRSFSTRAYYLLRLGMLEFGKRWNVQEDHLFMLDLNEVSAILHNGMAIPDLADRRLKYLAYRNFPAPNEFGGTISQVKAVDGELKGIGCSAGEIVGTARVITDIHKTLELTKEDILITLFTDPGWTPVLARVGGVVTEVGGLLSHAAVIGREYGIPAILNLNGATKSIRDGAKIRINGKTGVVEILEEGPNS